MKTLLKILTVSLFFLLSFQLVAQTDKEKAMEKGMKAIELMDNGEIQESIKILEECQKLDPDNILFPYEIAYAYSLEKNYKKAIKILEKLVKHDKVFDQVYQMLGNSYDYTGNPSKAISTYEKGLKEFPNSGVLHLERGNMELAKEKYNEALKYYEKGIAVQPTFPSNYYWACRIFCSTEEEVWGLIYGEIFMNLEPNTRRTAEISKILFDTYKNEITFTSKDEIAVSFCQNTISISDPSELENFKLPYCLTFEPILMLSIIGEEKIDLESLDNIRTRFVTNYFEQEKNLEYVNPLFDFHLMLKDLGYFSSYNHWLFMKGDEEAFIEWREENKDEFNTFVEWFLKNNIELTPEKYFHRLNH